MINEENRLLAETESIELEQAALFEQKQIVEDEVNALFDSYVIAKSDQVERIENRIEQLINSQMAKLQTLQNGKPSFLSTPSSKQSWSTKVNLAQFRLNVLQDRLEDVREIKDGMEMNTPRIQDLAMRKLRFDEPELMKKFDDIQTAVRVHRLHEKQRQERTEQYTKKSRLIHSLSQQIQP